MQYISPSNKEILAVSLCFIFFCLMFLSCNREASRIDIETELQGEWRGEWISKTLKDTTVVKTTLKIDKNVFYYNMGGIRALIK